MNTAFSYSSIPDSPKPSSRAQKCGSLAPTKPLDSEFGSQSNLQSSPLVSDWTIGNTTSSPSTPSKDAEREYTFKNSPYKAKKSKIFELDSIKRILSFDENIHQDENSPQFDVAENDRKSKEPNQSVKLRKLR